MNIGKLQFITVESLEKLNALTESIQPNWGVMSAQEMIEHVEYVFAISIEKNKTKLYTPTEQLSAYKAFLLSDKQFRENTKAPIEMVGETPEPLRYTSLDEAKERLANSINDFTAFFEGNEDRQTMHPAFGMLDYNEWVLMHYKHVLHHLKQFGLV